MRVLLVAAWQWNIPCSMQLLDWNGPYRSTPARSRLGINGAADVGETTAHLPFSDLGSLDADVWNGSRDPPQASPGANTRDALGAREVMHANATLPATALTKNDAASTRLREGTRDHHRAPSAR
ncbi:hypothetical protein [Lysobacter sp. HA18]